MGNAYMGGLRGQVGLAGASPGLCVLSASPVCRASYGHACAWITRPAELRESASPARHAGPACSARRCRQRLPAG